MPNSVYNLTTAHGRAQAHAHGPRSALIASYVEASLDAQEAEVSNQLDKMLGKALDEFGHDRAVLPTMKAEFHTFKMELGVRDRKEFETLLNDYTEQQEELERRQKLLLDLVGEIRKNFCNAVL
jgi:hypothetical protein